MICGYYVRTWVLWSSLLIALILLQSFLPGIGDTIATSIISNVVIWYTIYHLSCSRRRSPQEEEEGNGISHSDDLSSDLERGERHVLEVDDSSSQVEKQILNDRDTTGSPRRRLYFLDHLKVFLTFIVVSHHVACAFGAGGMGSWYIMVGLPKPTSEGVGSHGIIYDLLSCFTLFNQGYFMVLFFFVSSYFTPESYARKGSRKFHFEKAKRYGVPLLFVTFVLYPVLILVVSLFCGASKLSYYADPGVAWFLMWLIVFNIVYASLEEAYKKDAVGYNNIIAMNATPESTPLSTLPRLRMGIPAYWKRSIGAGFGLCGLFTIAEFSLLQGRFASMPISVGSLPDDILFFALGIVAYHNGWLESSLRDEQGVITYPWLMWAAVLVEAVLMVVFLGLAISGVTIGWPLFALVGGAYCVDTIVVILDLFQTYANHRPGDGSWITKAMTEAAYGVYLLHPLVVTSLTIVFVQAYNSLYGSTYPIYFEPDKTYSFSPLAGPDEGGLVLGVGWLLVNILSQLILWPLCWYLKQLPGLRSII